MKAIKRAPMIARITLGILVLGAGATIVAHSLLGFVWAIAALSWYYQSLVHEGVAADAVEVSRHSLDVSHHSLQALENHLKICPLHRPVDS